MQIVHYFPLTGKITNCKVLFIVLAFPLLSQTIPLRHPPNPESALNRASGKAFRPVIAICCGHTTAHQLDIICFNEKALANLHRSKLIFAWSAAVAFDLRYGYSCFHDPNTMRRNFVCQSCIILLTSLDTYSTFLSVARNTFVFSFLALMHGLFFPPAI
jgi:hypothetical protein